MALDPSAVDNALVAKLLGDSTLRTLLPDGVFFDESNPGATRFVIVSLVDSHREPLQNGRTAYEDALYLVKAVTKSDSGANIQAAASRINALLDGGDLAPEGYGLLIMRLQGRLRRSEVDGVDKSIRWYHRGGHYQVMTRPHAVTLPAWMQSGWTQ
jgi:hypothetical protein